MKLGMVVRCDQGGLGNQTHLLWKLLKPDVTLLIDLPVTKGRGRGEPTRYDAPWTNVWPWHDDVIPPLMLADLAKAVDVVLTVENLYSGNAGFDVVRAGGARTMLVANPELYAGYPADKIVVPTPWELRRMPAGTDVLPHPVDDPPSSSVRTRRMCQTFLHVAAPAMLDRNGTDIVMGALEHVTAECQLVVHSPHRPPPWGDDQTDPSSMTIGKVHVRWDPRPKRKYWDVYDVEADVMLLPRRYGGLCLPVQEAAACGLPTLMTDLEPQRFWPCLSVEPRVRLTGYAMRGGNFQVYDVDPKLLASTMDDLVLGRVDVESTSANALSWARSTLSWDSLEPAWSEAISSTASM